MLTLLRFHMLQSLLDRHRQIRTPDFLSRDTYEMAYNVDIHLEAVRRHRGSLGVYINVLRALILRDIKSRFLGSAWGYLISLGWPLSHIGILLLIHSTLGRLQPYGDSAAVWYSTGIIPFMAFSYTMRFIILGATQNSPLLSFPVVKFMDIVAARIVVEIFSVAIIFTVVSVGIWIVGSSFVPSDPLKAFYAIAISVCLGTSMGVFFSGPARISNAWGIIAVLISIILWLVSGVLFTPFFLPEPLPTIFFYNPIAQAIALFRASYFSGYADGFIDIPYMLRWCLCSLAIALAVERLLRGRMLQG